MANSRCWTSNIFRRIVLVSSGCRGTGVVWSEHLWFVLVIIPRGRPTHLKRNSVMSDVEDYPGPSAHPEKKGQDFRRRADEEMVKPTSRPEPVKAKPRKKKLKPR